MKLVYASICMSISIASVMAQLPETDLWLAELNTKETGKIIKVINITNRTGYDNQPSFSKNGKMLDVVLSYKADKSSKIIGVKRISKPSKRVYMKSTDIKPFKSGFGATILSTPAGILSNREAVKQKVGGEVLFKIW